MTLTKATGSIIVVVVIVLTSSRVSDASCPRGSRQTSSGCVAVQIPENAELGMFGNSWVCKRGFRNSDGGCVAVQIPENAALSLLGNSWVCKRGFRNIDGRCVAVPVPENAELSLLGNSWVCKRGFRSTNGRCALVDVPENAELDAMGQGWTCKQGFERVNGECKPMSVEELREAERAVAAKFLTQRAAQAACEADGDPIEGDMAEVVLLKASCGDWFVADGPNGYYLLEWFSGYAPSEGDIMVGPINMFGMQQVCYLPGARGQVWVDDFLLRKSSALEKFLKKCR